MVGPDANKEIIQKRKTSQPEWVTWKIKSIFIWAQLFPQKHLLGKDTAKVLWYGAS